MESRSTSYRRERLVDYSVDESLCRDVDLVFSVKNSSLTSEKVKKIHKPNPVHPEIYGVNTSRPYHPGLFVAFNANTDSVPLESGGAAANDCTLWKLPYVEARGIDVNDRDDCLLVCGGGQFSVYNRRARTVVDYTYPWLAHAHSIEYSRDLKRVLLSSTGFDQMVEIDLESARVTWEWCAWEHGWSKSVLGHVCTRSKAAAEAVMPPWTRVVYVDDPAKWVEFGLPTRERAVSLNAAHYFGNSVLFSFFHQKRAMLLDRTRADGGATEVMGGMWCPHGFLDIPPTRIQFKYDTVAEIEAKRTAEARGESGVVYRTLGTPQPEAVDAHVAAVAAQKAAEAAAVATSPNKRAAAPGTTVATPDMLRFMVTSTRDGYFRVMNAAHEVDLEVTMEGMPGLVRPVEEGEWLQLTKPFGGALFCVVDTHRSKFWLVDTERRCYRGIDIPIEWAIQEVFVLPRHWSADSALETYTRLPTRVVAAGSGQ